jgi:hypothetical protein
MQCAARRSLRTGEPLWAAISINLAPTESAAICERQGEKDFGQPASAGSDCFQISNFQDRRFRDHFRVAHSSRIGGFARHKVGREKHTPRDPTRITRSARLPMRSSNLATPLDQFAGCWRRPEFPSTCPVACAMKVSESEQRHPKSAQCRPMRHAGVFGVTQSQERA